MTDTTTPTPEARLATFRERRELSVVQPKGSLALVNTQWIDSEQTIYGVPGVWAPLPAGESGVLVKASADDSITVDGVSVGLMTDMTDDEKRRDQLLRLSGSTEKDAAPRITVEEKADGVKRIDVADTAAVRPGDPENKG